MELPVCQAAFVPTVGMLVRRLRTQRDWTLTELSTKSKVRGEDIGRIEAGRQKPQARTISKLAHALGVDVTELEGSKADVSIGPIPSDTEAREVVQNLAGGHLPNPPIPVHIPEQEGSGMHKFAWRAFGIVLGLDDEQQPGAIEVLRRYSAEKVAQKEPPKSPAGRALQRKRR